jgi:hypothetical protein
MTPALDLAALLERQLRVNTPHIGKLLLDRVLFSNKIRNLK